LPEKYPWGIQAQGLVTLLLVRQHVMQVIAGPTQGNDARFSWFGLVITQAHRPSYQVSLVPFKLCNLTEPASGPIPEDEYGALVHRQHIPKLFVLGVSQNPCRAFFRFCRSWVKSGAWAAPILPLLGRLRALLPAGASITETGKGHAPKGWYSLDSRTFEIDGEFQGHKFQICYLPLDWVGIRKEHQSTFVGGGIFTEGPYKIILNAEDEAIHIALRQEMRVPVRLITADVFKDRMAEVDQQTQQLVRQFCGEDSCRAGAAESLLFLRVPAHSVILACAEHATGEAQVSCVAALNDQKDAESLRVLTSVASNPGSPPDTQHPR
jgi:hypothetical protein